VCEPDIVLADFRAVAGLEQVPLSCRPPVWIQLQRANSSNGGAERAEPRTSSPVGVGVTGQQQQQQQRGGEPEPSSTSRNTGSRGGSGGGGGGGDAGVDTRGFANTVTSVVARLVHQDGVPARHLVLSNEVRAALGAEPFSQLKLVHLTEKPSQPGTIMLHPLVRCQSLSLCCEHTLSLR
jgi:hypothetical protein